MPLTALANNENKLLLKVMHWLGPVLLSGVAAIIVGYGSVQYMQGRTENRLQNVEADVEKVKIDQQRFLTREEFRTVLDGVREDLREIKTDMRAVRADLSSQR